MGGADTGESAQWGVVQWRLPEVVCELQREQGDTREMSVEHGQYVSVLCVCALSSELQTYSPEILSLPMAITLA